MNDTPRTDAEVRAVLSNGFGPHIVDADFARALERDLNEALRDRDRRSISEHKSGIIIPSGPPPGVVEALRNFVEAIEAYGETGVWPDNGTLRKLADEGREALNCGHAIPAKDGCGV